ncbi:hypothetical protein BBOV_I004995 [Babesia bovis T2Bo]|uniref:Uncharacterized protein n=1 Tax=Babesia bovis TaxID=5865 RepID=S6BNM5_BABBO|nr:hypothetical protein BBOV_I004995 [Babesia bovis T2Bo]KAG6440186.1 hypothetical protein BBOV_I004995 [Babesia bovis T2Bo]BAN65712.1 hypothetical protein [Babesia bovis]
MFLVVLNKEIYRIQKCYSTTANITSLISKKTDYSEMTCISQHVCCRRLFNNQQPKMANRVISKILSD